MTSFPEQVYAIVRQVPPGAVITYGAIATILGDPRKAREVGWAMAAAPDEEPPIPAQRVINARGVVTGPNAPTRRKQLEAEGVVFSRDGRIDLDLYLWLPPESGSDAVASE